MSFPRSCWLNKSGHQISSNSLEALPSPSPIIRDARQVGCWRVALPLACAFARAMAEAPPSVVRVLSSTSCCPLKAFVIASGMQLSSNIVLTSSTSKHFHDMYCARGFHIGGLQCERSPILFTNAVARLVNNFCRYTKGQSNLSTFDHLPDKKLIMEINSILINGQAPIRDSNMCFCYRK